MNAKRKATKTAPEEKPYKCSKCSARFESNKEVKIHEKVRNFSNFNFLKLISNYFQVHSGARPHKCPHCPFFGRTKNIVAYHLLSRHSNDTPFKCNQCSKEFKFENAMKTHKLRIHSPIDIGRPYKCDLCGEARLTMFLLRDHILRRHLKEKPFSCTLCEDKSFKVKMALIKHKEKIHEIFRIPCKECPKKFETKEELEFHQKFVHMGKPPDKNDKHYKVKMYECLICGRKFKSISSFRRHRLFHMDEKPFQCKDCSKSFKTPKYLASHVKNVHEKIKNSQNQRDECTKVFPNLQKSEFNKEPAKKSIQRTVFLNLKKLEFHKEPVKKPVQCDICQATFETRYFLNKHREAHFKKVVPEVFTCEICQGEFGSQASLKKHQAVHGRKIIFYPDFEPQTEFHSDIKIEKEQIMETYQNLPLEHTVIKSEQEMVTYTIIKFEDSVQTSAEVKIEKDEM